MNGLSIPLQKGAWNSQEFWGKIPGYPGFFVHTEKRGIAGPGKAWKAKRIFSTLSSFFLCAKKPGNAKKARSSGHFFMALQTFLGFFWKGPRQLVFLDSILTDICLIKFIAMSSKLVLFISKRKQYENYCSVSRHW